MCGIAGTVCLDGGPESPGMVEAVVASQRSRGPDHEAILAGRASAARLVLGHSRLKILDLSPESDQPLWDHERRLCLVFNGEIYNYRRAARRADRAAATASAPGGTRRSSSRPTRPGASAPSSASTACSPSRIWDCAAERFYLVRDRFGIKPLYYWKDPHRLFFASTCDALARRLGLEPDLAYAARGIRYWVYDDDERAPYVGLRSLPPGQYATVDLAGPRPLDLEMHAYYSLADAVERQGGPAALAHRGRHPRGDGRPARARDPAAHAGGRAGRRLAQRRARLLDRGRHLPRAGRRDRVHLRAPGRRGQRGADGPAPQPAHGARRPLHPAGDRRDRAGLLRRHRRRRARPSPPAASSGSTSSTGPRASTASRS